jgi:ribulose-phosphate 3-epimerase
MIVEPENLAEAFKKAGADILTVHYEVCKHLHRNIQQIKSLGMQAGIAINPHTRVELLRDILPDIDVVLIMSVNPGFGGQSFIPNTLEKIRAMRKMINESNLNVKIEVDGGVSLENAKQIVEAGADILVAGNAIFKSADPKQTIHQLKSL